MFETQEYRILIRVLGFFCVFPTIISIINFKRADLRYRPFLILMICAFLTELYDFLITYIFKPSEKFNTLAPINFYILLEFSLYLWLYKNFHVKKRKQIIIVGIAYFLFWIYDIFFLNIETGKLVYHAYLIGGYITLFIAVKFFANQIYSSKFVWYKNPEIIISTGLIIYYSFFIINITLAVIAFYFLPDYGKTNYSKIVSFSVKIANALVYLIFTYGLIWSLKTKN